VQDTGEAQRGIRPEDLLFVPHGNFFRRRGLDEVAFQPYDVQGNLLTEDGKPVSAAKYLDYLKRNLPAYYMGEAEFAKYEAALLAHEVSGTRSHTW
jgi:hypothetical protein